MPRFRYNRACNGKFEVSFDKEDCHMKRKTRVGLLTSGGDCQGLNAAIRGVGKTRSEEHTSELQSQR